MIYDISPLISPRFQVWPGDTPPRREVLCDLVRRSGRAFDVRIDGRPVATGRLPAGWLHRRRLVKYTADPTVVDLVRTWF